MADKYLGSSANTNEFKFQEMIRILDATLAEINPKGLLDGQNCRSIIRFFSSLEGFDKFVSKEFAEHIDQEFGNTKESGNVRGPVKKVLMYPRMSYLPWVDFETLPKILDEIKEDSKRVGFKLQIIDGKVYGSCISVIQLDEIVFDKVKDQLPSLQPNTEPCHITIVNSNIVADIGQANVEKFIKDFDQEFTVTTGKIKSTFSEDWSVFSECYVIEIECPYIDDFLSKFNQEFGKNINPAKHITFAIKLRSLWAK